jgi:hypothetical protein
MILRMKHSKIHTDIFAIHGKSIQILKSHIWVLLASAGEVKKHKYKCVVTETLFMENLSLSGLTQKLYLLNIIEGNQIRHTKKCRIRDPGSG